MWWSVPKGETEFGTWSELSTVYHEGVPGHHLQVAQAVFQRKLLNKWRRMMCWTSGHGEGWALYAERLMDALGHLPDPADRLGMLDRYIVIRDSVNTDAFMNGASPESLWDPNFVDSLASDESVESADIFATAMENNFKVGKVVIDAIINGEL